MTITCIFLKAYHKVHKYFLTYRTSMYQATMFHVQVQVCRDDGNGLPSVGRTLGILDNYVSVAYFIGVLPQLRDISLISMRLALRWVAMGYGSGKRTPTNTTDCKLQTRLVSELTAARLVRCPWNIFPHTTCPNPLTSNRQIPFH